MRPDRECAPGGWSLHDLVPAQARRPCRKAREIARADRDKYPVPAPEPVTVVLVEMPPPPPLGLGSGATLEHADPAPAPVMHEPAVSRVVERAMGRSRIAHPGCGLV